MVVDMLGGSGRQGVAVELDSQMLVDHLRLAGELEFFVVDGIPEHR